MIDQQIVKELSNQLKIDQFTTWREYLQLVFLKYFYAAKESSKVYFKGGTAIHFLLGSGRFSEDLDFTTTMTKADIKKLIVSALKNMEREVAGATFTEEQKLPMSFMGRVKLQLEYFRFPLSIRLEFSLREAPLEPDSSLFETIFPVGPFPVIAHLSKSELAAEKIRALVIRGKGRDVYDLWFLLSKKIVPHWGMVNKKMVLYKRTIGIQDVIEKVTGIREKDIKEDLLRFLPQNQREAVPKLKEKLLEKLHEHLSGLPRISS